MTQDRPIRPNKQYLQQKQAEALLPKQSHDFLKKDKNTHLLPCQKYQLLKVKSKRILKTSENKSKAQIYEEIKRKNIQKFGEKKDNVPKYQPKQQKKIKPSKMTVNYNPKPKIQFDEYKMKAKLHQSQGQHQSKSSQKKAVISDSKNEAKLKYEQLLQIIRQQQQHFNKKKNQFQAYSQSLKFKKQLQNEQTIPFLKNIKLQISNKILKAKVKSTQNQQEQQNANKICDKKKENIAKNNFGQTNKTNKINTKLISSQVAQIIDKVNKEKQKITQKLFQCSNKDIEGRNEITIKLYSIFNFNQIPKFDIQNTKQFIDLQTLQPKNNVYYKKAVAIFLNGLKYSKNEQFCRQKKTFTHTQIVQGFNFQQRQHQESLEQNKNQQKIIVKKMRMEGQKRIVKYDNNWVQVWHPGHQRLIACPNNEYKVVWLKNGDIKQEWKNKQISSYYCKNKNLVKINLKNYQQIMYFTQLRQLQQQTANKSQKQVLFKDGRIQIVHNSNYN